jgi:hypothetical protein
MATKRARKPRRQRASRKAQRYTLPWFEPYDLHEFRTEAGRIAEVASIDALNAHYVVLHALEKAQVEQVLKSLGCDPSTPDWRSAFFKLARHFCNVGQVQRARRDTRKWTAEKENILLREVLRLKGKGLSERQAIKMIAENPLFDDVLPHTEQIEVIDPRIRTSHRKQAIAPWTRERTWSAHRSKAARFSAA